MKELSKTKSRELKSLAQKKERERQGLFMVEGEKCVEDSLDAFQLVYLICTQGWWDDHKESLERYQDDVLIADKRSLEIMSSMKSVPDVMAVFKIPEQSDEIPLLNKDGLFLLLDEIQDPGNLGTIIRTCDWFGVYDIFASKNTVDVFSPKVVQSAMGSLSRVSVRYLNLEELITKNREIKVIGTLLSGEALNDLNLERKGMILMGNEGRGISEKLKNLIDIPVTIPPLNMASHPDSLNVGIATGIILSHLKTF